jgi:L-threonylcarbamoyladenylate synthase
MSASRSHESTESPESAIAALVVRAADVIGAGGVAAFPTETYYGLGADPHAPSALDRVQQIKGRTAADKPLLLLASSLEQVAEWVSDFPPAFDRLAARYWPGPLTLVLPSRAGLPASLLGPGGGVAVRISSHPVARALCEACGTAITGTSANRSGSPPCIDAAGVRGAFGDDVDAIVDAGPASGGAPSTIVDLCGAHPRVLRAGAIGPEPLGELIGLI